MNLKLWNFRNKVNGLIIIYFSFLLVSIKVVFYLLEIGSIDTSSNSILDFITYINSKIGIVLICLIYCLGIYILINTKEKIEDELVVEMRGKVAFQSFISLAFVSLFYLYLLECYKNVDIFLFPFFLVISLTYYVFKFYSSLKFADTEFGAFSILPKWIMVASIAILIPTFIIWVISGKLESYKIYLTIPFAGFLVLALYAYIKLSSYIFQKT